MLEEENFHFLNSDRQKRKCVKTPTHLGSSNTASSQAAKMGDRPFS